MSTATSTERDTDICKVCHLDRIAAANEGFRLCAIQPRTPEVSQELALLMNLLRSCERNCGAAGGWRR